MRANKYTLPNGTSHSHICPSRARKYPTRTHAHTRARAHARTHLRLHGALIVVRLHLDERAKTVLVLVRVLVPQQHFLYLLVHPRFLQIFQCGRGILAPCETCACALRAYLVGVSCGQIRRASLADRPGRPGCEARRLHEKVAAWMRGCVDARMRACADTLMRG